MPIRTDGPAPYAPPATVLAVIGAFRERGLTTPFTLDVLTRAGVTEALAPRTLQSLKLLDLIDDDGSPTPAFEALRRAPQSEYKTRLEEAVRSVYAEVFQFTDPAKDATDTIADAFRPYTPPGQRARMVTLFVGLCQEAGIIPEGVKPAASAARTTATRSGGRARTRANGDEGRGPAVGATAHMRGIPPALTGLLAAIPFDVGWTDAQREKFIKTFEAVLDFTVPTKGDDE